MVDFNAEYEARERTALHILRSNMAVLHVATSWALDAGKAVWRRRNGVPDRRTWKARLYLELVKPCGLEVYEARLQREHVEKAGVR